MLINQDEFGTPIHMDNSNLRKEVPSIKAHFNAVKEEVSELPIEDGLIRDPSIVTFRFCPICGANKKKQLFKKWGFNYVECRKCNHVFVENPISENNLLTKYEDSISDELDRESQSSDYFKIYWEKVYEKYINFAASKGIKSGKVLDVGAGYGAFVSYLKEKNYELFASEFSDSSAEKLIGIVGKNNYFHQVKLEDIDFKDIQFDLITMWGVLEHIYNPIEIFSKVSKILSKDGLFIALVPNFNSRAIKILGINTPTLNPRGHIQNYTDYSIDFLATKNGLKVIRKFGELPVIDLMHEHLLVDDKLIEEITKDEECYYNVYAIALNKG